MRKLAFILSLASVFASCRTVVDWDLPTSEEELAIEAYISNGDTPWEVELTRTRDYFEKEEAEEVANALVTISDDMGNLDTLFHQVDGLYSTKDVRSCIPGHFYTLDVSFEGKDYTATELCREQAPFDTVLAYYEPNSRGFIAEGYYVFQLSDEIDNENDFYQWKIFKNDSLQDDFGYILDSDEFADFSYFNKNIDFDNITPEFLPRPFPLTFEKGDVVRVEQQCINKDYFDFLTELSLQYNKAGSPFDAPPANPIGNIEGAWGYFAVINSQTATVEIGK